MKNVIQLLLSVAVLANQNLYAQTGPAGVGSTSSNPMWLDASRSGVSVTGPSWYWNDRSGNGVTASSTIFSGRPSFQNNQINGMPAFVFDGVNDHFQTGAISGLNTTNASWFIVGRSNNNTSNQSFLSMAHSTSSPLNNHRFTMVYNPYNTLSGTTRSTGTTALSGHGNITGANTLLATTTDATQMNCYRNGQLISTKNDNYMSPPNCTRTAIGRRSYTLDAYLNGMVAEIIVFNYELNSAERIIVENYLSSKYGIATANDFYAMESSGHFHELIGIGQNAGNNVSTATGQGILTLTNPSTLDDGDYVMVAHDGGTTASQITGIPSFIGAFGGGRLNRSWRIDYTGTPGPIDMVFNMTGINFGASTSDYVLLVDDDGDFTNGGTDYVNTGFSFNAGTNEATFAGIELPDGAYFTLGNVDAIYSVNDGNWTTPATWSCNCIPNSGNKVALIDGHNVTVNTSGCVAGSFGSEFGTSLSFLAGTRLSISGNIGWDGTWNASQSKLSMVGSSAQSIVTTSLMEVRELTINNAAGVTLNSGSVTIPSVLILTNGELAVASGTFILGSNATETARIAQVGAGGSMSGDFIVQRHIALRGAGFSDMSSPVQASTFQDWDNEMLLVYTYTPPSAYPSAWAYDETNWDYVPVTSATTPLVPGQGFEVYLDSDGSQTTFNATTINTVGTPNFGSIVSPTLTAVNDGWNLIGNPYASFITFNTFRTQNASAIGTNWMFYDEQIEDFVITSGGTIAPHQGFWVEALTGPTTVTFNENIKATSTSSVFRSAASETYFTLRLSSEGLTRFTSNTQFDFNDNYSSAYEQGIDAQFRKVPHADAPSLYSVSPENKRLRLSRLADEDRLAIPLEYNVGIEGFYTISAPEMDAAQNAGYTCVILEDTKLGTFFDLSSGDYRFNASSGEKGRFVLHLSKDQSACNRNLASAAGGIEGLEINRTTEGVFVQYNLNDESASVIRVHNMLGQEIADARQISVSKGNIRVNIPEGFSGIFIVSVQIGENRISKKFFNP